MRRLKLTLQRFVVLALCVFLVGAASYSFAADKEAPGKGKGNGYLGVNVERLSAEEKQEFGVTFGVLVTRLVKDQAAEKAGIKKYDVIQYFNDEKIRRPDDLVEAVRDCKPETKAEVKLVRDGKSKQITVTLGKLESKWQGFGWGDNKGFLFVPGKGGYLGVHLQELNKDLAEYFGVKKGEGALVLKVGENTPAEKAGLKAGDVITRIGDKEVAEPEDVHKIVLDLEEGNNVAIEVVRHKKKMTVTAEVGERPGFHGVRILRGLGEKGRYIETPDIRMDVPELIDGSRVIWEDKYHKYLKKYKERQNEAAEKIRKKLKEVRHYIYI